MRRAKVILLTLLLVTCGIESAAQTKIEKTSAPHTSAASGEEMFNAYCVSCHGIDGRGNGAAAPALNKKVPDLTLLAEQNHGQFPSLHVYQHIRGDVNSRSRGSKDMPVWCPTFMSVSDHQPAQVQQRVQNLTKHIESLQKK